MSISPSAGDVTQYDRIRLVQDLDDPPITGPVDDPPMETLEAEADKDIHSVAVTVGQQGKSSRENDIAFDFQVSLRMGSPYDDIEEIDPVESEFFRRTRQPVLHRGWYEFTRHATDHWTHSHNAGFGTNYFLADPQQSFLWQQGETLFAQLGTNIRFRDSGVDGGWLISEIVLAYTEL